TAAEGESPSHVGTEHRGIEQPYREQRTTRRSHPEAAVDGKVGTPAQARRNQFLDRRVDGRILATDARAGEKAKQQETVEVPRESRERRGHEIDPERHVEQLFAPQTIGEMAEEQGAKNGTCKIGAPRQADLL